MTAMSEGSQLRKLIQSFSQARHHFHHVTVFPDHFIVHRKPKWWRSNSLTGQKNMGTYIHTYIYFLLRQVGLRQPKGWWGPARNLILKLQKFTKNLKNLKLNTKLQKLTEN